MKNDRMGLVPLLAAILLLNGCSPAGSPETAHQEEAAGGGHGPAHAHDEQGNAGGEVEFSPGKGLGLSESARQMVGVQTSEVAEGRVASRRALSAQVFRHAGEAAAGRYRSGRAYATALLPEADAAPLRPGQKVELAMPDGSAAAGLLSRIDPQVAAISGQVELIIEVADPARSLRIGDAVSLLLDAKAPPPAGSLVIPETALLRTAKGDFVYVANGDYFLRTPITLGSVEDGRAEVVDGLFEGDLIVSQGAQGLYLTELQAVNAGTSCCDSH